ncbi:MAG: hypothetical protein ACRDKE_08415 [Solirubrobacterales bacterium]
MNAALLFSRGRAAGMWLTVLIAFSCLLLLCAGTATAAPTLDKSFGKDGFASPSVFPHGKTSQMVRGVAIQSDGKLVVASTLGFKYGHRERRPLIRLNTDGSRDRTYGYKGVAWIRAAGAAHVTLYGVKTLPDDGTLVWGGYRFTEPRSYWEDDGYFLAKLDSEGVVDKQFGTNGARRFSLDLPRHDSELLDIGVTGDGGVLATSTTYSLKSGQEKLRMTRFLPDGSVDRTFARNGTRTLPLDYKSVHHTVAVGGSFAYLLVALSDKCFVRRFNLLAGGVDDTSYGISGVATVGVTGAKGSTSFCLGLNVSPTGIAQIHGAFREEDSEERGFVERRKSDGSSDEGFGRGGIAKFKTLGTVGDAVIAPGGGVIASGYCRFDNVCLAALDPAGQPAHVFGARSFLDLGPSRSVEFLTANATSVAGVLDDYGSEDLPSSKIVRLTN